MFVRVMMLLAGSLSAPALACGPYGAGPEPIRDAQDRQVALLAPMTGELTVLGADGTWSALPTALRVWDVTVTDTAFEIRGWSGEAWTTERWSRATGTRLPDTAPASVQPAESSSSAVRTTGST